MDLSPYLQRGKSASYGIKDRDRFCMNCKDPLTDKESMWYKRSFCSEACYQAYVQDGMSRKTPYRHD